MLFFGIVLSFHVFVLAMKSLIYLCFKCEFMFVEEGKKRALLTAFRGWGKKRKYF